MTNFHINQPVKIGGLTRVVGDTLTVDECAPKESKRLRKLVQRGALTPEDTSWPELTDNPAPSDLDAHLRGEDGASTEQPVEASPYEDPEELDQEEPTEDDEATFELAAEDAEEFPKHVGGGTYELSNGERVRGKEAAFDAEENLT